MTPQSKGGVARAKKLGKTKRSDIARRAANARWKRPEEILKDRTVIEAFCRKHNLDALYAFGSVLGKKFGPKSDIDLLYKGNLGYFEACDATDDLEALFGRKVDFINFNVIATGRNPVRCKHILSTAKEIWRLGGATP